VETITQVDVSDSSLASLPSILFSLKHLVSLNAQSNKLTNLPSSETWNLPNLKEVNSIFILAPVTKPCLLFSGIFVLLTLKINQLK